MEIFVFRENLLIIWLLASCFVAFEPWILIFNEVRRRKTNKKWRCWCMYRKKTIKSLWTTKQDIKVLIKTSETKNNKSLNKTILRSLILSPKRTTIQIWNTMFGALLPVCCPSVTHVVLMKLMKVVYELIYILKVQILKVQFWTDLGSQSSVWNDSDS